MNPFDELLQSLGIGGAPSAEPGPGGWQTTVERAPAPSQASGEGSWLSDVGAMFGIGKPQNAVPPARYSEPEPFGIMDVLGIGTQARGMQRQFAYQQQGKEADLGRTQQQSAEEAELLQGFSKFQQNNPGLPAHQQVQKFLLDPSTAPMVARIPGQKMLGMVQGLLTASQPQYERVPAGTTLAAPGADGKVSGVYTAPSRETQERQDIVRMSPEDFKTYSERARDLETAAPGRESDRVRAINEMLRSGMIDEQNALRLRGNAQVRAVPDIDPITKQVVGYKLFDPTRGTWSVVPMSPQGRAETTGAPAPGEVGSPFPRPGVSPPFAGVRGPGGQPNQPPAVVDPGVDPNGPPPATRAQVVFGSGLVAVAKGKAGNVLGQIPGFEGVQAPRLIEARNQLATIGTEAATYFRESREFKEEMERRRFITPGPDMFDMTPLATAIQLKTLKETALRNEAFYDRVRQDQSISPETRRKAEVDMVKAQRFSNVLPGMGELDQMIEYLAKRAQITDQKEAWAPIPGIGDPKKWLAENLGLGTASATASPSAPTSPAGGGDRQSQIQELTKQMESGNLSREQLAEVLDKIRALRAQKGR